MSTVPFNLKSITPKLARLPSYPRDTSKADPIVLKINKPLKPGKNEKKNKNSNVKQMKS